MRPRLAVLALLGVSPLLASCDVPLPLTGRIADRGEFFYGKVWANIVDGGTVVITSSKGAVCSGQYVISGQQRMRGTLTCLDGREGPMTFVLAGLRGSGYAALAGDLLTFEFAL